LLDNAKAGRTLSESFEIINNSTNKNATAFELFGKRGAVVAQVLATNVEKSDLLTQSLINSGGAAERMARTQLDTLEGKSKLLTSAWEGLVLSLDDGDGAVSRLIGGFLELTTNILTGLTSQEKLSVQLAQTNAELNAEFELLKTGNLTAEQRSGIIENLNNSYAEYLPKLIQESDSLANVALRERIRIVASQELLEERERAVVEALKGQLELQREIAQIESGAVKAQRVNVRGAQESQEAANTGRILSLKRALAESTKDVEAALKERQEFEDQFSVNRLEEIKGTADEEVKITDNKNQRRTKRRI